MDRQKEWENLYSRARIENYKNGTYTSKKYTKKELEEKREYFESQIPDERFNIPHRRWMYEIKRHFELSENFKKYPDASFARLEFILKFGL